MKFLSLMQIEGMPVVKYQTQFLTLERSALGCFELERERVTQFVLNLRISLRAIAATFLCSTLAKAVMKALECVHAHEPHH